MRLLLRPRAVLAFLGVVAAAPVAAAAALVLTPAEASCQSGTCCPEPNSTCVIGSWVRADKYAKLAGGACKQPGDA